MATLTVAGMTSVEETKKKRVKALDELVSTPFNVNNEEQLSALRKYVNNFELNVNQMYLFQGLSTGLTAWGGSWVVSYLLPIPDFANYFLTMFLYAGAAGYMLQNFSMSDFHAQLDEMKVIYNWCLKNGQSDYNGSDNTEVLKNRDIQRLIKLIAPLCSTEFMVTWQKVTEPEAAQSGFLSYFSSAYSYFASSKPNVDLNRLQDLKASIEQRELDVGVFKGLQGSIEYFCTNPHFRELLMTKIKQPIDKVKEMLPSIVSDVASSTTHSKIN